MIYVIFQNLVGDMKKRLRGGLGRPWETETISPGRKTQGDHGAYYYLRIQSFIVITIVDFDVIYFLFQTVVGGMK